MTRPEMTSAPHLLIVDDDERIRSLLARFLARRFGPALSRQPAGAQLAMISKIAGLLSSQILPR